MLVVENCNPDENVEEVREDNLDSARKQQLSKTKKKKQVCNEASQITHIYTSITGQRISDSNMRTVELTYVKTRVYQGRVKTEMSNESSSNLPRSHLTCPKD